MTSLDYSVIIPAYNAAPYIAETLDAILAQRLTPREVIVIDDGSTDDTAAIVNSYPDPVRCTSVPNGGQGLARRIAILDSTSPWIALCDSDDIWTPSHIERRAELIATFPDVDFTFSDCYSFGPTADPTHSMLAEASAAWMARWTSDLSGDYFRVPSPYAALLEFNPMYPSGLVFRRTSYDAMGGFKEKYSRWIAEDSEFIRRFLAQPGIAVAGDRAQTWGYRRHQQNYSSLQWKNILGRARILEEHLALGVVPKDLVDETRHSAASAILSAFDIAFWQKDYQGVLAVYPQLPPGTRGLRCRLRYLLSRLLASPPLTGA